jgi:Leucine-rich repeat (LRR) protein
VLCFRMLLQYWLVCGLLIGPSLGRRRHRRGTTTPAMDTEADLPTGEPPLAPHDPLNPKRYKCSGVLLNNAGCRCSKQMGSLSITCFKAGLRAVPVFDFGATVVRTMNLERNKIAEIEDGDFYGLKIKRLLLANNSITHLNFLAFWGLEFNLHTLDLSFNKFERVPADSLRLLRNVKTLSLKGNKITQLKNYEFSYLHKLEVLSLDKNPISVMEDRSFASTNLFMLTLDEINLENGLKTIPTRDLRELKGLSLKNNQINAIPNGWTRNLTSLKLLYLDENKLNVIPADAFQGVSQTLRKLQMTHNKIRKLPRHALRQLTNLESLHLSHNRIKKVYARSFNNSRSLSQLDLSHNLIYSLGVSALQGLEHLVKLDLRYNDLITLDDRTFYWSNFTDRNIFISENPWLCNCLLKWLKRAQKKREAIAGLFADLLDVRCKRPSFLEHRPIVKIALRHFTCDHDYYYYQTEDDYYEYDENTVGGDDDEDEYDDEDDEDEYDEEEDTDDNRTHAALNRSKT